MARLFRQFSFPGGIPSHVAPEVPGSIHEGGELGYSLMHAYGAAFDNPDLLVACVVGDGEAETGPLAASWLSNMFLNPVARRRGAADPAPQRLQDRQPDGAGPDPGGGPARADARVRLRSRSLVAGDDPAQVHQALAAALDAALDEIADDPARTPAPAGDAEPAPLADADPAYARRAGPARAEVDGEPVEGTWRSHQVPLAGVRDNPEHLAAAGAVAALATGRRSCSTRPARRVPELRATAAARASGG